MATLKVTELGDYLKEQRQSAKMSLRQLAEQAGVSNPYLSQVERGLRKPSAEVLQQIAKGLRISAEALYVRAGILDEREGRVEVAAAIRADPHLTERQRRVLLDIYETFRGENENADEPRPARPARARKASSAAATKADGTTPATTEAAGTTGSARAARKTAPRKAASSKKSGGAPSTTTRATQGDPT